MFRTEQTYCPIDDARGIGNRIVFQLDLLEDKLRYCLWADSSYEDGTEDTIHDFQKSLHNGNIIHPVDVQICNQILQKQMSGPAITTSEIRVYRGVAGYPRYRMYTFSTNDAQGRMISVNGVLEGVQNETVKSRSTKDRAKHDSLFRKAVTSDSVLSMGFDCSTGKRLISESDVMPPWLPKDTNLRGLSYILFSQVDHPEEQQKLESKFEMNLDHAETTIVKPFFFDCKLRDLTRKTQTFRWYRVFHSLSKKEKDRPAYIYLKIEDIQETKSKELQQMSIFTVDPITGMLKRTAFENQIADWLERMKSNKGHSFVCLAILMIENTFELNQRYGRAYLLEHIAKLSTTVKAITHPNELCCRYGLGEFAMALTGNERETLDERLRMLQIACKAHQQEYPAVKVSFGSMIGATEQLEYADLILEQINRTLIGNLHKAEDKSLPDATLFDSAGKEGASKNVIGAVKPETAAADQDPIFIRTFGHFDVFVDGEAVLFNHPKAKELFALLVDRRGGFVSANEVISCLWEDEPSNKTTLARCRKAAMQMKQTLAQYGIDWIVETINGKRRVLVSRCKCDLEQYFRQDDETAHKMIGNYMSEYSWAENSAFVER